MYNRINMLSKIATAELLQKEASKADKLAAAELQETVYNKMRAAGVPEATARRLAEQAAIDGKRMMRARYAPAKTGAPINDDMAAYQDLVKDHMHKKHQAHRQDQLRQAKANRVLRDEGKAMMQPQIDDLNSRLQVASNTADNWRTIANRSATELNDLSGKHSALKKRTAQHRLNSMRRSGKLIRNGIIGAGAAGVTGIGIGATATWLMKKNPGMSEEEAMVLAQQLAAAEKAKSKQLAYSLGGAGVGGLAGAGLGYALSSENRGRNAMLGGLGGAIVGGLGGYGLANA